jgi:hypothetical protein
LGWRDSEGEEGLGHHGRDTPERAGCKDIEVTSEFFPSHRGPSWHKRVKEINASIFGKLLPFFAIGDEKLSGTV